MSMTAGSGIANQLSLFDFIDDMAEAISSDLFSYNKPLIATASAVEDEKQLADYLYRGEKILTLLREKNCDKVRYLPSSFLDRLNASSYLEKKVNGGEWKYVQQTATRTAREMWERVDSTAVEENVLLTFLQRYLEVNARIVTDSSKRDLDSLIDYLFRNSKEKPKGIVSVKTIYADSDYDYEVPVGAKSCLPKSRHLSVLRMRYSSAGYYKTADAGNLFWKALFICSLKEQIQNAIRDLSEEELDDSVLYRFIIEKQKSAIKKLSDVSSEATVKIGCMFAGKPFVKKVLEEFSDVKYAVESRVVRGKADAGLEQMIYSWFLSDKEDDRLPFELLTRISLFPLCELLEKVCDIYTIEKQTYEIINDLKKESAKVYQTKKNISLKCQKAMIASGFNDYFGYVEIDDECDLERFVIIEQQFKALSELIFKGRKNEDVSIRFRKLGRHHAAGLYYPGIKCLAVDVRSTDSLSHEYFHMLDYEHGSVSKGYRFSQVRDKYKECLLNELDKEENRAVKKQLSGNSKYNLGYYLTPTEVFARCGELYLTKIKNVRNSLVNPDESTSFAYPEDKVLFELIRDYFDWFLEIL